MRRKILGAAGLLLALALAAYVGGVAYLYLFQRDYVFKPGGRLAAAADLNLPEVQAITLTAADGTQLLAWYREAPQGRPAVLYFHGNAGTVSGRAERFRQILDSGFGLLAPSYRGYGGSGGSPSEAALFADALAAFDWLAARTPDVVLHGESLGTAMATYVAAQRPARALVLEAPFTAALDIAAAAYPWVPVGLLMRDPFLSREHIKAVEEPVLVVHGTADTVVPVAMGRQLFEAAGEPRELVIVEGARHNDLWTRGLWQEVLGFLAANGVIR